MKHCILDCNWKQILLKAWSVRLIILAGLLTGLEAALVFFTPIDTPRWFPLLVFAITMSALVARLIAQRNLNETTNE